ncbi:MAG: F0F1 ATP synthase subunit delta [Gemmatimonadaceae bacterium]
MDGPEGNPMQSSTISRNYAETLLILARKAEDTAGWGATLAQLASAINADKTLRLFLESPRVAVSKKIEILAKALNDKVPYLFLRFLQQLVRNRRQNMIAEISAEYTTMLDKDENRVFARVTVSRELSDAERESISAQLTKNLGKKVVPQVVVDPAILGGIIVRVGDTVMDGSVRRKLSLLRRRMVAKPSYSNA